MTANILANSLLFKKPQEAQSPQSKSTSQMMIALPQQSTIRQICYHLNHVELDHYLIQQQAVLLLCRYYIQTGTSNYKVVDFSCPLKLLCAPLKSQPLNFIVHRIYVHLAARSELASLHNLNCPSFIFRCEKSGEKLRSLLRYRPFALVTLGR